MTTKLSITKLKGLIENRKVSVDKVFVENQNIRFIICKTPIHQKLFAIHIPKKYTLRGILTGDIVSVVQASHDDFPLTLRQISYLSELQGNLPYDILSVSSEMLCHYKNKDDVFCYLNQEYKMSDSSEEDSSSSNDDIITKIEKKTAKIKRKFDKKKKFELFKGKKSEKKKSSNKSEEDYKRHKKKYEG